jgi:hypothetical protein
MIMAWFSAPFFRVFVFTSFAISVVQVYSPAYLKILLDHSPLYSPSAMKSYNQKASFCIWLQYAAILYILEDM